MPLSDNLISYWRMDESDPLADKVDVHGSNDLELVTPGGTSVVPGHFNDSMMVDDQGGGQSAQGACYRRTFATQTGLDSSDFSVSFWLRITATQGPDFNVLTRSGTTGAVDSEWRILANDPSIGDNTIFFDGGLGGWNLRSDFGANIDPAVPATRFVVATREQGGIAELFVDGGIARQNTADSGNADVSLGRTDGITIGNRRLGLYPAAEGMIGWIDECAYWSRRLSGIEAEELWNGGVGLTYEQILGNGGGLIDSPNVMRHCSGPRCRPHATTPLHIPVRKFEHPERSFKHPPPRQQRVFRKKGRRL